MGCNPNIPHLHIAYNQPIYELFKTSWDIQIHVIYSMGIYKGPTPPTANPPKEIAGLMILGWGVPQIPLIQV